MEALEITPELTQDVSEPAKQAGILLEDLDAIPGGFLYQSTYALFNSSNLVASPKDRFQQEDFYAVNQLSKLYEPGDLILKVRGMSPVEDGAQSYVPDPERGGRVIAFVRRGAVTKPEKLRDEAAKKHEQKQRTTQESKLGGFAILKSVAPS